MSTNHLWVFFVTRIELAGEYDENQVEENMIQCDALIRSEVNKSNH